MAQTIVCLQRLTSYGVTFHSYTEPFLEGDKLEVAVKNGHRVPTHQIG